MLGTCRTEGLTRREKDRSVRKAAFHVFVRTKIRHVTKVSKGILAIYTVSIQSTSTLHPTLPHSITLSHFFFRTSWFNSFTRLSTVAAVAPTIFRKPQAISISSSVDSSQASVNRDMPTITPPKKNERSKKMHSKVVRRIILFPGRI